MTKLGGMCIVKKIYADFEFQGHRPHPRAQYIACLPGRSDRCPFDCGALESKYRQKTSAFDRAGTTVYLAS